MKYFFPMILGYKSIRNLLMAYGFLLLFDIGAFLVRLSKWNFFTMEFQVSMLITSTILIIVFWELLRVVNLILDKKYPFERNIPGRMLIQLALGMIIGVSIRTLVYVFGEPNLPFKLDSLFIAATWVLYVIVPTGVNLGFFTHYFINRWKVSLILAERLEKEKSQVQFDNLKNQLNPHFLFNALASLNSLIFENQGLASQFLQHLSKVYRYVLQNKDRNFVSLQTELDFIQNYVFLMETRFNEAIRFSITIPEENKERAIVPVTLQILIENALKHNIADRAKPLSIEILTIGDYLVVSNNLQTRKLVETSNKQGLENLKSLYRFLTDRPVVIEKTDEQFFVKVPLI